MRSLLALITCALTACTLPPAQPLTPEQQQQMAENQRFSAALMAHSNDGGSTAAIIARAMLDAQSPAGQQVQKLMLFGGQGHNTYLGCLNCSGMESDSVLNSYGNFGSSFSMTSIFNSFSDYGSGYSSYSACNTYATDPPVIVDGAGNFYGRLTVNAFNPERANNQNLQSWLTTVCGH